MHAALSLTRHRDRASLRRLSVLSFKPVRSCCHSAEHVQRAQATSKPHVKKCSVNTSARERRFFLKASGLLRKLPIPGRTTQSTEMKTLNFTRLEQASHSGSHRLSANTAFSSLAETCTKCARLLSRLRLAAARTNVPSARTDCKDPTCRTRTATCS